MEEIFQRLEKRVCEGAVDVEVVLAATVTVGTLELRAAIFTVRVAGRVRSAFFTEWCAHGIGGYPFGQRGAVRQVRQIGIDGHPMS